MKRLTGEKTKRAEDCKFMVNGKSIDSIEGKAEVMNRYYEDLYKEVTPRKEMLPVIEEANVEADNWRSGIEFGDNNSSLNPKESKWSITGEELECVRRRLNNKKSSGEDGLSNFVIKKLPRLFWEMTRIFFNNCMANSYFPVKWKRAVILPLPKTDKAETPKEFRPISLLSNWGKCLEEVLLNRMKDDEGEVKGVPNNQFAYRPGHSAAYAVDLLCEEARV